MIKIKLNMLIIGSQYKTINKIRAILKHTEQMDVKVTYSYSFANGLAKCRDNHHDIILISKSTESYTELEILETLRHEGDDRPIVVISSIYDDNLAASLIKAGADDYMRADTIDEGSFLKSVRYALDRSRMRLMLKRAQQLEHHMAYHDQLTNLPNRQLLIDRLHQAINQSLRSGVYMGVIYLDLNEFKDVNDTLGHKIGDLLLKSVAERLKHSIRQSDTVSRLGGDEFMVILNGIAGPRDAARVAKKINIELAKPHKLENHSVSMSASIGISIFPWDGDNVDSLMKNADKAMYLAKRYNTGYQFYHRTMNEQVEAKIRLERNLLNALKNDELVLHFQPILETYSNNVSAFEVLLRWNHPEVGMMYPIDFLPVAEESDLIQKIQSWVINASIGYLEEIRKFNYTAKFSINVCNRVNQRDDYKQWFDYKISEFGNYAENFILEFNDPTSMENIDDLSILLRQAKKNGLQVVIDNFGSGFSSLALLNNLPLDMVKIDRSLLKVDSQSLNDIQLLDGLVDLTHRIGLKSIASGIETKEQDLFADRIECDLKQGYYYSKPFPGSQLKSYISNSMKSAKQTFSQVK